jgi:hypothetical protein
VFLERLPEMGKTLITLCVAAAQQAALELDLYTQFDLQVDDAVETGTPGVKLLTFLIEEEQASKFELIKASLERKQATGVILDLAISDPTQVEEEDEVDEEDEPRLAPQEQVALAYRALMQVEEEWVARVLGDDRLGVIQDALQEYMERRERRPLPEPLSRAEMAAKVRHDEYVSGVVAIDIGDIIELDLEGVLDELSLRLTGTELLTDITHKIVGHDGDTLWIEVTGGAAEVIGAMGIEAQAAPLLRYTEEMVVFTREEAQAILKASELDPWLDQGITPAPGHGIVLAMKHTQLGEDVVIPAGITGTRRIGLMIDGYLSDVLQHFEAILGEQRTWRAWPESDFALVVPDPAYRSPLDDPLLAHLAERLALEEAFSSLEDVNLTFVDLGGGYLIARNEQGRFETWNMLPDGRGMDDADLAEALPVVEYLGNLYRYGNTYGTLAEVYSLIEKEQEK